MLSSSTTIPIGSMLDFHVITYISNEMKLVLKSRKPQGLCDSKHMEMMLKNSFLLKEWSAMASM